MLSCENAETGRNRTECIGSGGGPFVPQSAPKFRRIRHGYVAVAITMVFHPNLLAFYIERHLSDTRSYFLYCTFTSFI